ncbi:WG repeat-containing protein [Candidatus Poribacteria bacterium]|nr:WG repeat-containing protein [Candidatus Poribacteria bacterium]
MVIKPQFDDAGFFDEGVARVKTGNRYGYIDKNGKYVWKPVN